MLLADPKGRPIDEVRALRDEIRDRVGQLVSELDGPGGEAVVLSRGDCHP